MYKFEEGKRYTLPAAQGYHLPITIVKTTPCYVSFYIDDQANNVQRKKIKCGSFYGEQTEFFRMNNHNCVAAWTW